VSPGAAVRAVHGWRGVSISASRTRDAPVFSLRRPSNATIDRLLAEQARLPLSYDEVGSTRGDAPPRLPKNHHRVKLGSGAATFAAAKAALATWAMYDLPWTEVYPHSTPVRTGTVLATVIRHIGFWSVNPCRIVYLQETTGEVDSWSFALGTLPDHAERGEERFRVEWHRGDDAVWFEILAFAGPRHWMARLGAPFVYRLQKRFGREALRAVRAGVAARGG
jgi:uncharacterized protein (UPF0548 family)